MKRRDFSYNQSTRGFSVAVSSGLFMTILRFAKDFLLSPLHTDIFRREYSREIEEFSDKLSPLALNKRFYKKTLLGVKITFYYED